MNPFPCKRIEISRECGNKCLPLACLHLCNAAVVEHSATNYLHTKLSHENQLMSYISTVQEKLDTWTSKCRIPSVLLAASRTTANASGVDRHGETHQHIRQQPTTQTPEGNGAAQQWGKSSRHTGLDIGKRLPTP